MNMPTNVSENANEPPKWRKTSQKAHRNILDMESGVISEL